MKTTSLTIIAAVGTLLFLKWRDGSIPRALSQITGQPVAASQGGATTWVRRDVFGNWTSGTPSDGVYSSTLTEQQASLLTQCGGWDACLNDTAAQL